MAKKAQVKKEAVRAPQSVEELADFVRQIGIQQRTLNVMQATVNGQVEKIKVNAMQESQVIRHRMNVLFEGAYVFCQANRDKLTQDGKSKTVKLATGEVSWRISPPSVSIKGVDEVLAFCEKSGLLRFVRVKKEPDKEAMLREPDAAAQIKGVTIVSGKEDFVVKPSEVEIEVARDTKQLQKAVKVKE